MKALLSKISVNFKSWWNTLIIQPTSLIIGFFMGKSSSSSSDKQINYFWLIFGAFLGLFLWKKRKKIKGILK